MSAARSASTISAGGRYDGLAELLGGRARVGPAHEPAELVERRDVLGAVGAKLRDSGALFEAQILLRVEASSRHLGPHVRGGGGESGDHQREPLGDATGVNAGAVQRTSTVGAGVEDGLAVLQVGIDPSDGCDHVLARAKECDHLVFVRKQRTVDHAVSVEGEDVVDTGRRSDSDRVEADEFAAGCCCASGAGAPDDPPDDPPDAVPDPVTVNL